MSRETILLFAACLEVSCIALLSWRVLRILARTLRLGRLLGERQRDDRRHALLLVAVGLIGVALIGLTAWGGQL